MPDTKILNLRLSEKDHMIFKVKAARRKMSIKRYLISLVENDENDELEFEELDENDLKDLEKGRKEIAEGKYKTLEQVKELLQCQS
jgi:predicted DNA binding CopG/RHH family protein